MTIQSSAEPLLHATPHDTQRRTQGLFENQLFSYKEAARYLRISEPYLRRLKQQGKIPFVQISRRGVRFRLSSLSSWVEQREIK